jgi:hypothetical protein
MLSHRDLEVYEKAFDGAMPIFECSKGFPKEEIDSLTDPVRRSTRSVGAHADLAQSCAGGRRDDLASPQKAIGTQPLQ